MRQEIKGIILAAGFGTRLRPLTDPIPKPLIPVLNQPLLGTIITKFANAGIKAVTVNGHYHSDKLEQFLAGHPLQPNYLYEPEILGTGGPVINAKSFLANNHFLLHNGDILTDINLTELIEQHCASNNIATMVLIDGPENCVNTTSTGASNGMVHDILDKLGRAPEGTFKRTYAGITLFSPEIFNYLPAGPEFCSIITAMLKALREKPGAVGAYLPETFYWNDIGTIRQYYQVHADLLQQKIDFNWPNSGFNLPGSPGPLLLGNNSKIPQPAEQLAGFNCIGNDCLLSSKSYFQDCIIMDKTTALDPGTYNQEIISGNFIIHKDFQEIDQLDIMKSRDCRNSKINMLVEQGSDRRFYRLTDIGTGSADVLMISYRDDPDFQRYVTYGNYYQKLGLQTPAIFDYRHDELSVLMEDLGDLRLYEHLQNLPETRYYDIYTKVIDELIRFQVDATRHIPDYPDIVFRDFYYEYFRWESNYFRKYYLDRIAGIPLAETEFLDPLFHQLATDVKKQPHWIIHRDFQSQNIMLTGDTIRFVDFQGTRLAPFTYDLMSLIKDPYINLSGELRNSLQQYYFKKVQSVCRNANFAPEVVEMTDEQFNHDCILSSLQRNMQALGAYGFLALVKGKKQYLDYVPQGLRYLHDGIGKFNNLSDKPFSIKPLQDLIATHETI